MDALTRHDPRETWLPFQPAGIGNRLLAAAARTLHRRGLLWRTNVTVAGSLAGRPLRVPLLFGSGWEHLRMGEVWLFRALQRVMAGRPGAFVDVGVNVGHTLIKVMAIDPARQYIGFEPNPQCLCYTRQLVAANGFPNTAIVPAGISNRTGVMKLLLNPDVDPSATIVEGFREPGRYARSMLVPVFVGDDVLDSLGVAGVGIVKIDVEGGELDVIEGLARTLRRDRPYVFCEVLPVFDPATDMGAFRLGRQAKLREVLDDLGYAILRMHVVDDRAEEIDDFGVHADMTRANYVFVPRAGMDAFGRLVHVELRQHRAVV